MGSTPGELVSSTSPWVLLPDGGQVSSTMPWLLLPENRSVLLSYVCFSRRTGQFNYAMGATPGEQVSYLLRHGCYSQRKGHFFTFKASVEFKSYVDTIFWIFPLNIP